MTVTPITLNDLTQADVSGDGVFDVLMRTTRAHLNEEYQKQRIKGAEYAQVYLGSLAPILDQSVRFLLEKDKAALEAQLVEQQVLLVQAQTLEAQAKADLVRQQIENAKLEHDLIAAQVCKLKAEYDVLLEQRLKTVEETGLLAQKKVTERAQTVEAGVDEGSVVGRQKLLYKAQTEGFQRDAEQKAAKLLVDSWNVRRTTDEGTVADSTNKLDDATIGRAVSKLLSGVGA